MGTTKGMTSLSRIIARALAVLMLTAAALTAPSAASAGTYTSANGSQIATSITTLDYSKPHGTFKQRIWITRSGLPQAGVSTKYAINMYDRYGNKVWGATDQGDRTYTIGGNVTKIVIYPATLWYTLTTNWKRV